MLERVWQELERQSVTDPASLARRLGLAPDLVRLALDLLERRGLLERVTVDPRRCRTCPLYPGCARAGIQLWRKREAVRTRSQEGIHDSGTVGCQSGCSW